MDKISYDDFKKMVIKIGTIKSAEKIPDTDKLLRLEVDFGPILSAEALPEGEEPQEEREIRQIVSGIAKYYPDPQELVEKQFSFVYNLAPRMICGYESNGMILGVAGEFGFAGLAPTQEVPSGSIVG